MPTTVIVHTETATRAIIQSDAPLNGSLYGSRLDEDSLNIKPYRYRVSPTQLTRIKSIHNVQYADDLKTKIT